MGEQPVFSSAGAETTYGSMETCSGFSCEEGETSCVTMKGDQALESFPGFNSGAVTSDHGQCSNEMDGTRRLRQDSYQAEVDFLCKILDKHKMSVKNKCEGFFERIKTQETVLNMTSTKLFAIEGRNEGITEEHEVLRIGKTLRNHPRDTQMDCLDIFKQEQGLKGETEEDIKEQKKRRLKLKENMKALFRLKHKDKKADKAPKMQKLRTVLTKGVAGIGKTSSVQKFLLDWAEGEANQDVDFMFVLPFRELNLIKDDQFSLHDLLSVFHPELKDLDANIYLNDVFKSVFIFDGLDESRIPLNFPQCNKVSDVTMVSSVDVLITNLLKGELLPSALIWITSRPAAASQIPPESINRVTEIQGFGDPQKEEYFRLRFSDQDQAQKIISHIKTARIYHIMCQIPIFCWISAKVLQKIMNQSNTEIPTTLTEMYCHFLITQTTMKNKKYEENKESEPNKQLETHRSSLLKLAELACKQLMRGNVMFNEEDLIESGIDVTEVSMYSGMFWEIFREECGLDQRNVYCFVHLSFQEFLAALYVFYCYENKKMEVLRLVLDDDWHENEGQDSEGPESSVNISPDELLKRAVNKAVRSQNGHLDLFLNFLLGISLESNQKLLQDLLTLTHRSSEEITKYIMKLIKEEDSHCLPTEKSISLFLCLSEMKDQCLSTEIQEFLKSEKLPEVRLSPGECSVLTHMLLTSEELLDVLDLKKYNTSEEGYRRLMPLVTICRKALLGSSNLSQDSWKMLCSALQSANYCLKELDLSDNDLQDPGVELLSAELNSSHCKLETLRLPLCKLGQKACEYLGSSLQSVNSPLKELDLSNNDLQDPGVEFLCAGLKSSHCKLETLRLAFCNLGGKACKYLASALQSVSSSLKKLDLSNNDLKDSGVDSLSAGLKSSCCKLETLRLSFCSLGGKACEILASVLHSANSPLKVLDLSKNDLKDSGVELLSAGWKGACCKLEKLRLSGCMVTYEGCSSLASALKSNSSSLRELDLSYNHPGESGVKLLSNLLEDPHCNLEKLQVKHGGRIRIKPGLKKYACQLTLDTNTAHSRLYLSEENRKVQRVEEQIWYLDHLERFKHWEQVLSVESLPGHCYWEAEWSGVGAYIAVSYRGISREGDSSISGFGLNNQSWSVHCSDKQYSFRHNEKETVVLPSRSQSRCRRVGVYLDWPAGALSFYSISPNTHTLSHLHTFYTSFSEPLHAGFRVDYGSSVLVCEIE